MRLKKFKEEELSYDSHYLIKCPNWSDSGYGIAQYNGSALICQASANEIPFEDIEKIAELE